MTTTLTPAATGITTLHRIVAGLAVGDRVRVTFNDLGVQVGTLRMTVPSIVVPAAEREPFMVLDVFPYPMVRRATGLPASQVLNVERWDDDARFDLLMDWAQDYLAKAETAQTCPKSEQGPAQLAADEAKTAFIDEWMRGQA